MDNFIHALRASGQAEIVKDYLRDPRTPDDLTQDAVGNPGE